ncbi:hypothetical protein [Oceanivirga miroungae]|uniref:Uncharacterized protein n=1 Tax=Oceanivirga miroungae TaxID=1130046 RepID=A0A6I8MEH0_9FUSO|nr:hypothetical protein [Oceanivirga miroungae]VWL85889.1 hypothetical protein OMES3154_01175 [Oceanivirga miroungae]
MSNAKKIYNDIEKDFFSLYNATKKEPFKNIAKERHLEDLDLDISEENEDIFESFNKLNDILNGKKSKYYSLEFFKNTFSMDPFIYHCKSILDRYKPKEIYVDINYMDEDIYNLLNNVFFAMFNRTRKDEFSVYSYSYFGTSEKNYPMALWNTAYKIGEKDFKYDYLISDKAEVLKKIKWTKLCTIISTKDKIKDFFEEDDFKKVIALQEVEDKIIVSFNSKKANNESIVYKKLDNDLRTIDIEELKKIIDGSEIIKGSNPYEIYFENIMKNKEKTNKSIDLLKSVLNKNKDCK